MDWMDTDAYGLDGWIPVLMDWMDGYRYLWIGWIQMLMGLIYCRYLMGLIL
jgi:hypothetical protein